MNSTDYFKVLQVLEIIETKLITESNTSEYEFYLKLKGKLDTKVRAYEKRINK